jgi:hypothetical protein
MLKISKTPACYTVTCFGVRHSDGREVHTSECHPTRRLAIRSARRRAQEGDYTIAIGSLMDDGTGFFRCPDCGSGTTVTGACDVPCGG